jgi:hypothetical protein
VVERHWHRATIAKKNFATIPFFARISIFSRFAIPQLPLWRGKIKNVLLITSSPTLDGNRSPYLNHLGNTRNLPYKD